jgi:opacity protein-like surface antigen
VQRGRQPKGSAALFLLREGLAQQRMVGFCQSATSRRAARFITNSGVMKMQSHTACVAACIIAAAACEAVAQDKEQKQPLPLERTDIVVHPITSPYWHEDSFVTSDLRPVYVYHAFPGEILGGGQATVTALQIRIALTKSLQLVAYKDGWVHIDTPALDDDGWNDLAAGLKWAFLQDDARQLHAAAGIGYEFSSGDDHVLQDDDALRFWLSLNKGFGRLHLGATVNYHRTLGNGDDILGNSDTLSWHLHLDYQVCEWFSPVLEVNGYHTVRQDDASTHAVTPFSGADFADLGGDQSENVITAGLGVEVRPWHNVALRAAYEVPLTDNLDVYGHRWTFSAVVKF